MPSVTLLDYEVFEALRAQIESSADMSESRFSEDILGYGFLADEGAEQAPVFVLLCSPQAITGVERTLQKALPAGGLKLDQLRLPVAVSDSAQNQTLQHALTLAAEPATPHRTQQDLSDWVQVSLTQTLRQVIIKSHRKIILPSYLLRYTPYTSPNLILLRAALSQIHYLHQSGSAVSDEFEHRSVSARMSEITRWSSLSRTSIYRLLHEDPRSKWLVEVENKGSYQNDQGQQIALPNQYTLQPLQLTPGDAADLAAYLSAHRAEWNSLEDCLIDLAKINPREILAYPYRTPQDTDWTNPASVLSVLQTHFGTFELNAERLALLDKVRDNLIGDDFVAIPWYVLRSLLPVYGASIITLYIMCQPLLYRNGGVQRDTFWLPGGDQTLTDWTGDRSLAKYFPKANNKGRGRPASPNGSRDQDWRKNKRDLLGNFFLRTATRKDEGGETQWQIQVHDFPILPEDERLMTRLYALLADLLREGQLDALLSLFEIDPLRAQQNDGTTILDLIYRCPNATAYTPALTTMVRRLISDFETPEGAQFADFETPASRIISLFETPVQSFISKNETSALALFSELETYLKILFRIKDSLNKFKDSADPKDTDLPLQAEDWNLEPLLSRVQPEKVSEIKASAETVQVFKAWLIWGALRAQVHQPLNFAISQTLQKKELPEHPARRLAELPLPALLKLLEKMLMQPESLNYQRDAGTRAWLMDMQMLLLTQKGDDRELCLRRLLDLCLQMAERGHPR